MKMNKYFNIFCAFVILAIVSCVSVYADEIKVVFTGQSYAMLYPCSCPMAPNGGVARRAALIKKLRAAGPNVLVVEAGSSVASGRQDQYSQNYEADIQRTDVYLQSLKAMGYDALLVSGQECAFGTEFLKRHEDMPFVSTNTEGVGKPYIIKSFGGVKIGILGLTDISVLSRGLAGWQAPISVLGQRVSELKKQGVSVIILLSSLEPSEDEELLKNCEGIDIVINGSSFLGSVNLAQAEGPVYLSTWWQAKTAGVLTLQTSGAKIIKKSLENVVMSSDIPADETVASLLPQCFGGGDCQRIAGFIAKCENAQQQGSRCVYISPQEASLVVVRPKACRTCRVEEVVSSLKGRLGLLKVEEVLEGDAKARDIIAEFKLTMLPAYVLGKDIERSPNFSVLASVLQKGKASYLFKPSNSGVSYILARKSIPKRLDVFFSFSGAQLPELFRLLKAFGEKHKDIDVHINFIAVRDEQGAMISKGGVSEIEEFARTACIDELLPQKTYDYLLCRSTQTQSSWWDTCAAQGGIDAARVKECVFSDAGRKALLKRIKLTEELEVASGPTIIVDNKEIFSIVNVPKLEEFEKAVLGYEKQRGQL
ncbi:MAG: hypothetical protein AUJ74_06920 [Candidatus Omnitrophica bacterium CG1_02_44_16]|nr:MAG: hypothetical protein AUJ74_06920 [Candidatus Omnitrophica bacterium CG1_02_44_16]PIY82641.1 MAG: hypothetical protein COY78_05650 [Candidatus Omnitrophica bacterium CG_4_10_14_0_8_um_filter_44_12]PIZ84791.1 MAG: hypothetical protein COX96_02115 [Candidatus Omnitrophica bacterium CG_4_10_14_0_2_um_filter_44_9]